VAKIALNIPGMGVTFRVAVVLAFFALCGIIINISPVEAYQQQGGSSVPPYLEQLDGYRNQTLEHFRLKEEQKERSRILENSVQLHLIKRGETLSEIALLYGVDITALAYWNNLSNPNRIRAGEVLHVLTVNGTLHHVEEGDTLTAVASRYNVESQKISDFNMLDESQLLVAGNKLVIPDSKTLTGIVPKEPAVLTLASRVGGQAPVFRWPLVGRITSFFGMRQGGFHLDWI
jgi:LysM repeat protein